MEKQTVNPYVYKMKIIIILLAILISSNVYAQKEKITTLKSVQGEYSVILEFSDITGRQATQLAREDAKRKAIEKVCGTRINIWDQMESSSAGDVFNSLSINQVDGEIVEFDIKEEGHKQSETRSTETIFYCIANVTVKKGIKPDPDFYIAVNGLKSVYYTGESLLFSVTPYRDCYMKIFLLEDEKHGYLLYPNNYDKVQIMPANKVYSIADSPYYEFILQKNNQLEKEINRLVFVFTKTERPFNEKETSRSEIEKWIATIPNDQKYLYFSVIEIRDK